MAYPSSVDNGVYTSIQLVDANGTVATILKIDSSGNTVFQEHPTGQQFSFSDKNGNLLVMIDNTGHLVVNNNQSIRGRDTGGTPQALFKYDTSNNVLFVAGTSGSLQIQDNSSNTTFIDFSIANGFKLANSSGTLAVVVAVDGSGNTVLKAHTTNNQILVEDSSGNVIAKFAGTNKITTLNGGQISARTAVSGNYTILASDHIIAYTSTSSAFTATLPAAAAGNAGQRWIIKDESGGAATHNITVNTSGGNIDGTLGITGVVINTNYGALRVYSNGSNYFTM